MSLRSFTLFDRIERNARLHGQRTAYSADGVRVTHAEYAQRVQRLSCGLAAAGVSAGDRIAIVAHNGALYLDLFGAAARLGAIVVPVNWRLAADEVAHVLADTAPRVVIAAPDLLASLANADVSAMRTFSAGVDAAGWPAAATLYRDDPAPPPAVIDDTAGLLIVHTAAVGGKARGALLSHRGLLEGAARAAQGWGLTPQDVHVGVLPLFHIAGIAMWMALQAAGGSTIVMPRFDPKAVVEAIEREGGSVMGSFPPMLAGVLDAAAAAGSALKALRVVSGLESPETLARFAAACPHAEFWVGYGQTETSGSISTARLSERPGSAGIPVDGHVVAIVDDEDHLLPTGATGEIVVRGPMVFLGYWQRDPDNAFTLRNGWHHTGDMGRLDADGYLWYMGRSPAKELIKPGGENVYPAEVERTLAEHPAVAAAVVFGVPDAQWGEAVKAVCEARPGAGVAAEALIEFVGQRIARYKKPKHVVFVERLPRNAAGAVDRAAVKAAHCG